MIKLLFIVFIDVILCHLVTIYIRYYLLEKVLRLRFINFIVETYFNKYKKWDVYTGWNGHGFSIFNKKHARSSLNRPENWCCKTIVPYWIMRHK